MYISTQDSATSQYRLLMEAAHLVGSSKANAILALDITLVLDGKVSMQSLIDSTLFLAREAYKNAQNRIQQAEQALDIFGAPVDIVFMAMVESSMYRGGGNTYERRVTGLDRCRGKETRLTKYGYIIAKRARTLLDESVRLTREVDPGAPINLTDYYNELETIEATIENYACRLEIPYASTETERHTSQPTPEVREAREEGGATS